MTLKTSSEKPGITPAWAGKSDIYETLGTDPEDHPRVGGEKCGQCVVVVGVKGSPPRGRGKADHISGHNLCARITPAWAGKSGISHAYRPRPRDHPRVGGEKQTSPPEIGRPLGSPPRGRGKVPSGYFSGKGYRITPAWAGKRLKRSHRSGIFISGPIPFHSVLHRPAGSGGSRAGRDGAPAGQPQNAGPA